MGAGCRLGVLVRVIVLWLLASGTAGALPEAPVRVAVQPAPVWVEPPPEPLAGEIESTQGQALELLDFQTRHVRSERWRFVRTVIRVTSELGVQEVGQRRFRFVPPHERLILHELEVERGGRTISHLDPDAVQLLRREVGLEASVYDNERTAVVVLPDVRVGDTVRYAYSVVGANPVHEGRVMESWAVGLPMAAGTLRQRLLTDRALGVRAFAGGTEPQRSDVPPLLEYRWQRSSLPATRADESMPVGHDVYPWVQLSELDSWSEVAEWGARLFRVPALMPKRVRDLADEIRAAAQTEEERAALVLRRVQDEVRYLSLAFAESTHRPAPPDLVLKRRFGDCKDKSLLAVTLLGALGLDAHVALVSTTAGRQLPELLPTAKIFDHAIVSVVVNGRRHWLDPTRLYQRGRLPELAARGFHHALLLAPGQQGLTAVAEPEDARPDVAARLRYRFAAFGDPVDLSATVTYTRGRAEAIRAMRASSSPADFERSARGVIRETYPQAASTGELTVIDYEERNEIVISQSLRLNDAWVTTPDGRLMLTLHPPWMRGHLPVAASDRKHPLGLEHPLHVVHDVAIELPEPLRVEGESVEVSTGAISYHYASGATRRAIQLHYELSIRLPQIEVAGLAEYRDALARIQGTLDFSLWKAAPITGSRWPPLGIALLAGCWALVLLGAVIVVERRQPYLKRPRVAWEPALAGRRGWLALLGLGVTLAPVRRVIDAIAILPNYSEARWKQLTTESSYEYHALHGPVLTLELFGNVFFVLGASYVAYLYWAKRRSFPLVFSVVQITSLLLIFGDHVLASRIETLAGSVAADASLVVLSPITLAWVLYVLSSRRVKATFLPDPDAAPPRARRRKRRKRRRAAAAAEHDEPVDA